MILTSSPASGSAALSEIRHLDPGARLRRWLEPGLGWVDLVIGWDALAGQLREHPPIFCRHLCPVQVHIPLQQQVKDLDDLSQVGGRLSPCLGSAHSFSVQTRLIGSGWPYTPYDVNRPLSQYLIASGMALDVRQPEQILSVVLTPTEGFLGWSRAIDNLSDWAGGARRFKREKGQISRAEFKLLEALELFALQVPAHSLALDLGASPGGWTRVLRTQGARVMAVDPGDLDARLNVDPGVTHVRQMAQDYMATTRTQFDVILNDMRMDARASARIMVSARGCLKQSGWALMTLKLPERGAERIATSALDVLREGYRILGARQLFHNRNEVTVALTRGD